ncbi:BMP family lipoprotein [Dolosicoccus paucivorans]|uniref:BMP family ABC transporter substrate-binding protein n=1 Tax=Dolosicoccus paucivorans TaxID=84521 RepID=A0A1G8PJF8_9LACT|nr:BMP family protein [Dolosicoccus paucivorans]PMB83830.1 BMP family ABC transporter substrate-binding protein [Dolosicoccus paucivorans]PMC57973.1 BMP family ABC transporter substrate-binding protein [Dolosicoccus paucivorans]SDI92624.1 nucleoside-binding protein [Dolosicoccus paucivorans]
MKRLVKAMLSGLMAASVIVTPLVQVAQAEDAASIVMVTDQGGVDDKSFNQSAWEGIQAYGEEHGLEKGAGGYNYLQSNNDSEFITNFTQAVNADFDLIYGIGFKLIDAMTEMSAQYPDQQFVIVDGFVDAPNVAALNFKDNEAAFLAGVAAASATKTNKLGFVGGVEGFIIDRFEAGFVEGAKAVNPDIEITVEYVGSFADPAKGKQIAATMYANDVDVIYHAAGDSGNGVFSEAKDIVENDPERDIWVVGVDRDQEEEGIVTVDGEERHLTLTSSLKEVGNAVQQFANDTNKDGFQAGEKVFGLKEEGVGLTKGNLSDDVWAKVEEYRGKIIDGELEVPEKPER